MRYLILILPFGCYHPPFEASHETTDQTLQTIPTPDGDADPTSTKESEDDVDETPSGASSNDTMEDETLSGTGTGDTGHPQLDDCLNEADEKLTEKLEICPEENERVCMLAACEHYYRSQHAHWRYLCVDEHTPDDVTALEELAAQETLERRIGECLETADAVATSESRECTDDEVTACES